MHQQQAFSSSNGGNMAHQPNQYTTVPPSQQQQGVQANHNQSAPGAAPQRHHPSYPSYATQTSQPRPQQPSGGTHGNQPSQRMMSPYVQGGNPQYIAGGGHLYHQNAQHAGTYYNLTQSTQSVGTSHRPSINRIIIPSHSYYQQGTISPQCITNAPNQTKINMFANEAQYNAMANINQSGVPGFMQQNILPQQIPRQVNTKEQTQKARPKAIKIRHPETLEEVNTGERTSKSSSNKSAKKNSTRDSLHCEPKVSETNDEAQKIIADFQSKVIQAKSEGSEPELQSKKIIQDTGINQGQGDDSDKEKTRENSSLLMNNSKSEIHSDNSQSSADKSSSESKKLAGIDHSLASESTITTSSVAYEVTSNITNAATKPDMKFDSKESKPADKSVKSAMCGNESKLAPDDKQASSPYDTEIKHEKEAVSSGQSELPLNKEENETPKDAANNHLSASSCKVDGPKLEPISPTSLQEYSPPGGQNSTSVASEKKPNSVIADGAPIETEQQPRMPDMPSESSLSMPSLKTGSTDEVPSNVSLKNLTGKSKREEINKKKIGSEMDAFQDTNLTNSDTPIKDSGKINDPIFTATGIKKEAPISDPAGQLADGNAPIQLTTTDRDPIEPTIINNIDKIPSASPDSNDKEFTPNSQDEVLVTSVSNDTEYYGQSTNHIESNSEPLQADLECIDNSIQIETPVLENGITEKGPTLKYDYKPDQWSPINVEGKKQYDREFLMKLQQDPLSMTKPENLPNMDIIKDKAIAKISSSVTGPNKLGDIFNPSFVKPTISNRGPPARASRGKKDPRQGPQDGAQNKRVITLPEVNKPVFLATADNAWKPSNLKEGDSTAQNENEEKSILLKQTRSILNKLTPQKFDALISQFKDLKIDTDDKIHDCMVLIYEKALDEPAFSATYAKMCEVLKDMNIVKENEVQKSSNTKETAKKLFKSYLITKCQHEFQRDYLEDLDKSKYNTDMLAADTENARREIKDEWEEKERRARRRSLGNIRFIGELYKLKMLTVRIIHECVTKLLDVGIKESTNLKKAEARDESLECLCKLLTTVGERFEADTSEHFKASKRQSEQSRTQPGDLKNQAQPKAVKELKDVKEPETYFDQIKKLSIAKHITARVRFMLLDVVELRKMKWRARIEAEGPKKIDDLREDIHKEKTMQQLHEQNVGNSSLKPGRSDSFRSIVKDKTRNINDKDDRSSSLKTSDGFKEVVYNHRKETFNPDRMRGLSSIAKDSDISLIMPMRSSQGMFSTLGKGSGSAGSRTPSSKQHPTGSPMAPNSNRFSSLSAVHGTNERSVSPSGQPFGSNFERQESSGSQSPTSTLERQHRAGSGGSRSMGPTHFGREYNRGPSRGPHESSNERENVLYNVQMHMQGGNIGSYGPGNYARIPSNGPPGVAIISGKSPNKIASFPVIGPSDDEIRKYQEHEMKAIQIKKRESNNQPLEPCFKNVLEEYLNSCDEKEVEENVKESLSSKVMSKCITTWVEHVMEAKSSRTNPREALAKLCIHLVTKSLLQRAQCIAGLGSFLNESIDYVCDCPKLWDYLGELVAPLLKSKVFGMDFLLQTSRQISSEQCQETGLYVEAILRNLCKSCGQEMVSDMWKEGQLAWDMFLPESSIDGFIQEHNLEYTGKQANSSAIDDIIKYLQNSKPAENNGIQDLINSYLKDAADGNPDPQFIRKLTTAVAESTIKGIGSGQPTNCYLDAEAMQQRAVILKRLLDAKVDRETQALYALQALVHKLEHPNKLLHQIFECLYQADVITYEGFEQWENSTDPAEQDGKGVAMKSTTQFFTWLREVDPDEES